ncbi:hypothetical protein PO909_027725 [Leuciscus waleckii]
MKFIIFIIFIPLVYSELHTFMAAYTGQRFSGILEFSAVTTLDDQQIDYYDSNITKLIPKPDWVKESASEELWKEYIQIREKLQQIYKTNIPVLMETFTQSQGVHTYQRMYGCEWDDETRDSQGFDQYGYDGEDFISLDLKKLRYIAPVPQAFPTVQKWNKDRQQLEILQKYLQQQCVSWLRDFLHLSKATSKKTDPPKVSLLQKNLEDYVKCHVTGFLFRKTTIMWRKNGQAMSDSRKFEYRDTLPNEDGTFQKTAALYVLPDEWKKNEYTCVVEHKSLTEPIQKILTEDQIMRNKSASDASYIMYLAALLIIPVTVLIVSLLCVVWKKLKDPSNNNTNGGKTSPSPEHAPSQDSLTSTLLSKEKCIRARTA